MRKASEVRKTEPKKEDEQRIKQFVADAQMKYGKEFN